MRVVVLGGVAWNEMLHLAELPPPVSHTVFPRWSHEALGSSGAGKALNLALLGAEVTLWAPVGDDERGERVRSALGRRGVTFLATHDPAGTMHHVNLMSGDGGRISIFAVPGSRHLDGDPQAAEPGLAATIAEADLIVLGIFDVCRPLLPAVAAASAPVLVDVHDYDGSAPYHRDFLGVADLVVASDVALPDPLAFLRERIAAGATTAVCTRGAAGAIGMAADGSVVEVDAVPVDEVVDTNGAGDAFSAAMAVALLRGRDLTTAMTAGSILGAAAVRSPDLAPASCPDGVVRATG